MAAMYCYLGTQDLRGKVYGGFKPSGGFWEVKQDGATSLRTGARLDSVKGCYYTFDVIFSNQGQANTFMLYCAGKQSDANINLYIRTSAWYYKVWGVVVKPKPICADSPMDYLYYMYEVICYLYSPYAYAASAQSWAGTSVAPPQYSANLANAGHIGMPPESLKVTCPYTAGLHVTNLKLTNTTTAAYLYLCNYALTNEVWTLYGPDNRLTEYFSDTIASATQFNQDTVRSGTITYSSSSMLFQNAAYAIYRLAGPNPTKQPAKMCATLSLDSGGATGKAYVEIASSASGPWTVVLDEDDFESGYHEYVLQGTEYMTDIYVRIRNASGTSGKYLRLGAIAFYAERVIQTGSVPEIAAGATQKMALYAGSAKTKITFTSTWRPARLHVN
jgi:hypothetical protein